MKGIVDIGEFDHVDIPRGAYYSWRDPVMRRLFGENVGSTGGLSQVTIALVSRAGPAIVLEQFATISIIRPLRPKS